MPQSLVGLSKQDLDTPVLCLDVERFERNVERMATAVRGGSKSWRPHSKGHKTPAIAWHELRNGASGITCAKVGEAEIYAAAGIRDILIANVIAGARKAERLAGLCRFADPIICVDHFVQADQIASACRKMGVTCRVLVDVNIGMNRTGIRPGKDASELGMAVDRLSGLKLVGIMGYEGHLLRNDDEVDKSRQIHEAMKILENTRDGFLRHGLNCEIVSAGGTGSVHITSQCPAVTELQAGGGIFGDPLYTNLCGLKECEPAVSILATVISRPTLDRAILDAGRKSTTPDAYQPSVKNWPDAQVKALNAEHCIVDLGPESQQWRIGDQVELTVGYTDFTTPLHDEFFVFRGNRLEAIWPIWARGRLQ